MDVLAIVTVQHVVHEVYGDAMVLPEVTQGFGSTCRKYMLCYLSIPAKLKKDSGLGVNSPGLRPNGVLDPAV